jgi:hypothetical protein
MNSKNKLLLLLISLMLIAMPALTACGGGSGSGSGSDEAAQEEAAPAEDESAFLIGTWFAESASFEGQELDPEEVYGGTFYLYFAEDGDCQMCIDQKRAPVKWEYDGETVTLTGDDTYKITFPDDSKTSMVASINGVETVLTKHEE